jgi:hypothetical protein
VQVANVASGDFVTSSFESSSYYHKISVINTVIFMYQFNS